LAESIWQKNEDSGQSAETKEPKVKVGDVIVRVDPRYFRPTEVESLLGDSSKARKELGWETKISFDELVKEMMLTDMEEAKRDALVKEHGYKSFNYHE
jgi:GDPmannose 4,6-dehydratase